MTVLLLGKVINFENSVKIGRIPYTLLIEKQQKSSTKFIYLKHFRRAQLWVYPNFMVFFRFDYCSNTEPYKAISIAAS